MKRVVIIQSNYIPWKGYFDLLNMADEVVLYDDAQYTKNDWRNRNRIKTAQGPQWLTIPVRTTGSFGQRIRDARAEGRGWRVKHWRSIEQNYRRANFFADYAGTFEPLYLRSDEERLSHINFQLITAVCSLLDVKARITWSWDYDLVDGRTERLVSICQQLGATDYLSGPAAREYLDVGLFDSVGIKVAWMDYSGYPEYQQFWPPFEHAVSVLDPLFLLGPNARTVMKSFSPPKALVTP